MNSYLILRMSEFSTSHTTIYYYALSIDKTNFFDSRNYEITFYNKFITLLLKIEKKINSYKNTNIQMIYIHTYIGYIDYRYIYGQIQQRCNQIDRCILRYIQINIESYMHRQRQPIPSLPNAPSPKVLPRVRLSLGNSHSGSRGSSYSDTVVRVVFSDVFL